MNFLNQPIMPEVAGNSKTKSRKVTGQKRKKRAMAKASRRMNRYQTTGGQKTKFKKSLRVHA